ncbi:MAG TPA: hypothetical protein VJC16_06385 [Candidatus Nanoarchaeia archaeon]|nr:hypothetical protein [Candidatus Nanoarchaeia archaeon]
MSKTISLGILMLFAVIPAALAIPDKELADMREYLSNAGGSQVKFEVFLAFSNERGYDFSETADVQQVIAENANAYGILLMPYTRISGMDKASIDAETRRLHPGLAEGSGQPLRLNTSWTIALLLAVFAIIIVVLEHYRKEKVKGGRRRRR